MNLRSAPRSGQRAGHTDIGTPLVILAIIALIAASRYWDGWGRWKTVLWVACGLLAVAGIVISLSTGGLGSRSMRE